MSGGVCRRRGIIRRPLAAFGPPHHHSGRGLLEAHSLRVNWTGRKSMTTNSHMFTARGTTFGPFLCCLTPPPTPMSPLSSRRQASSPPLGVCPRRSEGFSCCRSTKPGPCVEMRPPGWTALSLPPSPAGSRGSGWLVALCLQTDGNGQRVRRMCVLERRGGGAKRVSLFSLSAPSPQNNASAATL